MNMAKRKYAKLKALMYERDVRQIDLEPVIGRKIAYISTRLNGKEPWNTQEMQAIGTLLEIGLGRRSPDCIKAIFEGTEKAGAPCETKGLLLESVSY